MLRNSNSVGLQLPCTDSCCTSSTTSGEKLSEIFSSRTMTDTQVVWFEEDSTGQAPCNKDQVSTTLYMKKPTEKLFHPVHVTVKARVPSPNTVRYVLL